MIRVSSLAPLFVTVLVISAPGSARANDQVATLPTDAQTCEKYNTDLAFTAVKRTGPGRLAVEVLIENKSNVAFVMGPSSGKQASLVDSNGDVWKFAGSNPAKNVPLQPGVKMKRTHSFELRVGGNDSKTVSVNLNYQIGGTFDLCRYSAKNLPIS